jgi:hypothetical protein
MSQSRKWLGNYGRARKQNPASFEHASYLRNQEVEAKNVLDYVDAQNRVNR